MREDVAPASPVGARVATVHRGLEHLGHLRIQHATADALDARPNALAGNRAPDEHNLSLMPRQHPAAGNGFLYVDRDLRSGLYGHH